MTILASVVIPTFQRPALLERCLTALVAQHFDPYAYEIIVVDDAASQETYQQVQRWLYLTRSCGHTICYLPVTGDTHGPAAARNLGWRAARGDFIAFTDDDCIPDGNWLKNGLAAFTDSVVGVSGRVIVPLPDAPTDYEYNASHLEQCEFATANCFYRRAALARVGGFDERFTAAWREDSDLFFTFLEQGAAYVLSYDAIVVHPVRPERWGISLQQQRKSMFNALLYKKHPRLYRKKIQPAPPWNYYAIVGASLLACIGILKPSRALALCGLLLWGWLTGSFCLRRLRHTSRAPHHVIEMFATSLAIPPLSIAWRLRGAIQFRVFFL